MPAYNWVITRDVLATRYNDLNNEKGVAGPRGSTFDWEKNPDAGDEFRMLDDDNELYYVGRITGDWDGFEPLDDFGTPNAGCTSIEYRDPKSREWVAI